MRQGRTRGYGAEHQDQTRVVDALLGMLDAEPVDASTAETREACAALCVRLVDTMTRDAALGANVLQQIPEVPRANGCLPGDEIY